MAYKLTSRTSNCDSNGRFEKKANVAVIGPPDGSVEPTDDSAAVTTSVAYGGDGCHPDAFRGDILADVTAREETRSAIVSKETEDISVINYTLPSNVFSLILAKSLPSRFPRFSF